jgi:hypothetical protein
VTPAKIIAVLKQLNRETIAVESSIGPKGDWGWLINVDATASSMQLLYEKISSADVIGEDRIAHILCDGAPPKIQISEAPVKYADRGKRWSTNIRDRISAELQAANEARTFFWTKAGGVGTILAIVIALVIWIVPHFPINDGREKTAPLPTALLPQAKEVVPSIQTPQHTSAFPAAPKSPLQSAAPTTQSNSPTSENLDLSFEQFVDQYHRLDQDPFEQAAFLKYCVAKRVRWIVAYEGCSTEGEEPSIDFRGLNANMLEPFCFFAFTKPERKGAIYRLKKGQLIEITGQLQQQVRGLVFLDPADFRTIEKSEKLPSK